MSRLDRLPPASPCIARCVIDETAQICIGCARTLDEIAVWGSAPEAFRAAVWAALPARASALGLVARRLPWRGEVLLERTARLLDDGATLTAGVWGASAEFRRLPGAACDMALDDEHLTVAVPQGALRLHAAPWLTAFEIDRPDLPPLTVLAVPQGRALRDVPRALTPLGPDPAPLLARDAQGLRYDLGLGRRAARFVVRCDAALAPRLQACVGTPWPEHLVHLGFRLASTSPVRIVETTCLKVEIDAEIPPPDGASPPGPHTHLLSDHVAQGLDLPPTVPLPAGYVATALLRPK